MSQFACLFLVLVLDVVHWQWQLDHLFLVVVVVVVQEGGQKSWLPMATVAAQQEESPEVGWNILDIGVALLVVQECQRGWHSLLGCCSRVGLVHNPSDSRFGYRGFRHLAR